MSKTRYYTDANSNYYSRCRDAHQNSGQRCTICLGKSTNVHHATYGNDVLGISIFPVCAGCHDTVCHKSQNWVWHKDKMKCRNTPAFIEWIQMQYQYVQTVHNALHGELKYTGKKNVNNKKAKKTVTRHYQRSKY